MHLFSMEKVEVRSSSTIALTIEAIDCEGRVLSSATSNALKLRSEESYVSVSATHEGFSETAYAIACTIEVIRDGQVVDTGVLQARLEFPRDTPDITISVRITE